MVSLFLKRAGVRYWLPRSYIVSFTGGCCRIFNSCCDDDDRDNADVLEGGQHHAEKNWKPACCWLESNYFELEVIHHSPSEAAE